MFTVKELFTQIAVYLFFFVIGYLLTITDFFILKIVGYAAMAFLGFALLYTIYQLLSPKQKELRKKIASEWQESRTNEIKIVRDRISQLKQDISNYSMNYGVITKKILFPAKYDEFQICRCRNLGIIANYNISSESSVSMDEIYDSFKRPFLVFEENRVLVIDDKVYKFEDIINYTITDNTKTIYSEQKSTTKTNTGSLLGRAVLGGLAFGAAGAVIGGVTAKQSTTTSQYETEEEHDYAISVTINDLANPTIIIKLFDDATTTQEIASVLSIIINKYCA